MRRASCLVVALTALVALTACAGGDDAEAPPEPATVAPTAAQSTTPSTTLPPPTALVPGTEGGDEEYPEPTPAPTEPLITTPVDVTPTTAAATVPESAAPTGPPTSEPLAVQELVLSGDGVGSALLGTDPEAVIEYVSSILGANTADSGWVGPDTFGCFGNEVRRVDWGVLSLLFGDGSDVATGRRHFFAWEYGRVGSIGDEPVGLRTAGGVTLGSRVVDVLGEFPDAQLIAGDPEVELPDLAYVDPTFYTWLSGVSEDDFVTVMFGGHPCGG